MKVRFLPDAWREFNEALAYCYRLRPLEARDFLVLAQKMGAGLAEYPDAIQRRDPPSLRGCASMV